MKPCMTLIAFAIVSATAPTLADNETPSIDGAEQPASSFANLKAPEAVREGNRLLLDDKPVPAIEAYRHAQELEPDVREIDFVQGLAYFKLGEYDQAREAFENAATSSNESLVDDAIYSIGTTYHARALQGADNPQEAIAQLENAMQRYHTVLSSRPNHAAAADANYKAASMWRVMKEQLEQQEQQQQQNQCDNEQEQKKQQDQDQQQQNQQQEQEQSQQADESEQEQDQQEEQQARESQEEQVSREQAERKLREMMQALRDRKKERPKRIQPVKAVPVEKDW